MYRIGICVSIWSYALTLSLYSQKPAPYFYPDYWKEQALKDILPSWTRFAQDPLGGFYTELDSVWIPNPRAPKFPSMLSRHLFSYSTAYLMSGEEKYFTIAETIKTYLLRMGWDKQYGGWYDALTPEGNPKETTKSVFVQVYVITGLTMYYMITRDPEILDYIKKSNEFLEYKVWDKQYGGYFNIVNQDWSVLDNGKSFSSLVTPVSGYLFYLYLATGDRSYLKQIEKITTVLLNKMRDPVTGWILENFTRDWNYIRPGVPDREINIGHNLETAWICYRLFSLNGNQMILNSGIQLGKLLENYGFDSRTGMWAADRQNDLTGPPGNFTYWWIQNYGMMFDLYRYHIHSNKKYLQSFNLSAAFWDQYFLDRRHGDTYFSVDQQGNPTEKLKGNQFKTSYHSMENALLLNWYLSHWVTKDRTKIFIRIESNKNKIYPWIIEDSYLYIQNAQLDSMIEAKIKKRGRLIKIPKYRSGKLELDVQQKH